MGKLIDLTGMRFGWLSVLNRADVPGRPRWWCQCDCGETTMVSGAHLRTGDTQSCGCLHEALKTKHGHARNRRHGGKPSNEWEFWNHLARPKPEGWETFEQFLDEVGQKPTPKHFIHKRDNRLSHGPGNTYYTTQEELNADTFTRGEINFGTDGGSGKAEAERVGTTSGVPQETRESNR